MNLGEDEGNATDENGTSPKPVRNGAPPVKKVLRAYLGKNMQPMLEFGLQTMNGRLPGDFPGCTGVDIRP